MTDPITQTAQSIETASAWLNALSSSATTTILNHSDLPQPVKDRLAKNSYDSPEALHSAISAARSELDALTADGTIELNGRPHRSPITTTHPLDTLSSHLAWFFGVDGAATPPANMRRLSELYIALTGDSDFHGVFQPDRVQLAGANTATLANMAVDAMNKVIQTQFSNLSHWRWYEQVALAIPNDGSVHDLKFITFGGVGDLPTVAEGAAYTELPVADDKETATFNKKGGYVGLTLEMIRNSNIAQIQAVPRALAIAALRTRSGAVANLFTANSGVGPTLSDNNALFHTSHANINSSALDQTAWRAARSECFAHSELGSGKALAVFPRYALVSVDQYDTALSLFGYGDGLPVTYTPEAQSRGLTDPRPVPLVVPDWTDPNDWGYVVDPAVYPVIQISYAQAPGGGSHPAPELYTVTSPTSGLMFTNDTLPIKVRDWFAVGVNGPRGIGKRNVA